MRKEISPDLAAAFRCGDDAATEQLFEQAAPKVTALVSRLLAWPDDVEDVVQDVFVAAFMARRRFRGEAKFETWITRIAVNRCRAHQRKKWCRQNLLAAWRRKQPTSDNQCGLANALLDEQLQRVRRVIADLPQTYREVVVLFYLQQLPAAEVARVLKLKTNTVERRLSRARDKLARALADGSD